MFVAMLILILGLLAIKFIAWIIWRAVRHANGDRYTTVYHGAKPVTYVHNVQGREIVGHVYSRKEAYRGQYVRATPAADK